MLLCLTLNMFKGVSKRLGTWYIFTVLGISNTLVTRVNIDVWFVVGVQLQSVLSHHAFGSIPLGFGHFRVNLCLSLA